jgi:hypothetical protein
LQNLSEDYIVSGCFRFVRAVGYRWMAKWLFGIMGWENTRPLPACLYHVFRTTYGSDHLQGYVAGHERADE